MLIQSPPRDPIAELCPSSADTSHTPG